MNPAQMMTRAPHSPMAGTGWLMGWRLTFGGEEYRGESAFVTIVEDSNSQVFTVLYDVSGFDERELNSWEGIEPDMYNKLRLRVQTLEGPVLTWLHVLNAYEGGLPSADYLALLADSAQAAGAPEDYVAELRSRRCRDVES